MESTKKVPTRRFKGFTDVWEQRKLGDFTSLITKGTTPKDKSNNGDITFVKVENLSNGQISSNSKINVEEHEGYLKRSQLKEGDILFSIAGTLGRTASVDKTILPANTNQALAIIRGYQFDKNFLLTSLSGKVVNDYIRKNPTIGAQPNLSLEQVKNLTIWTPNEKEQTKIGNFFKQLDDTIALHQRKLNKLKNMKQAYLQEMFPAAGETKPKRRFKGFTDDWESKKLNEFCTVITKQTGFDYSKTIKPSLTRKKTKRMYPFIQNKDFSGFKVNLDTDFYIPIEVAIKFPKITLDAPSLLITISGKIGNVGLYNEKSIAFIGGAVGIAKLLNVDEGNYIVNYLQTEIGQHQFKTSTKTSSHANTTVEIIRNLRIYKPANFDEMKKVSSFFKKLDEKISLQEQKLTKLKQLKSAYLEEMFV